MKPTKHFVTLFCFCHSFQDKILQCGMAGGPDSGKMLVTNDGATILSKVGVDNPVAKVLIGTEIVSITNHRLCFYFSTNIGFFLRYFKSSR